jgi:rRNA-processing protein FCF1
MEQSQGEILPDLLIDACGWAAVVDAKLNIDIEIERTIGPSRWILPIQVKEELERMNKQRRDLLLDLLFSRAEIIDSRDTHTDDTLISISKKTGARVLTVDKELKRRLVAEGCGYLEVVRDRSLRLIE